RLHALVVAEAAPGLGDEDPVLAREQRLLRAARVLRDYVLGRDLVLVDEVDVELQGPDAGGRGERGLRPGLVGDVAAVHPEEGVPVVGSVLARRSVDSDARGAGDLGLDLLPHRDNLRPARRALVWIEAGLAEHVLVPEHDPNVGVEPGAVVV